MRALFSSCLVIDIKKKNDHNDETDNDEKDDDETDHEDTDNKTDDDNKTDMKLLSVAA